MKSKGILIALAWPQTFCKQAGAWYDPMLNWLGIAKNNYYRVGHAAVLLIHPQNGEVHYFDFGRYHAPFGHGRVRSKQTDHELKINTIGQFDTKGQLTNYEAILGEIANKKACHGEGVLHASQTKINFLKALQKANQMQTISPIAYGPFLPHGTNCSRFVRSVMKAGSSGIKRLQMHLPITVSPTPIGNVKLLNVNKTITPSEIYPALVPEKKQPLFLRSTLPSPSRPIHLPISAQWLAGEGGGSWFHWEKTTKGLFVKRFDPNGNFECEGIFTIHKLEEISTDNISITHPSHCGLITFYNGEKMNSGYRL